MTRHHFDPLSFVFGALFVGVATLGLIDRDLWAITDLRWIAPGALVLLGVLLLVLSARRTDREPAGAEVGDGTGAAEDAGRGPDPSGPASRGTGPDSDTIDDHAVEAGPSER